MPDRNRFSFKPLAFRRSGPPLPICTFGVNVPKISAPLLRWRIQKQCVGESGFVRVQTGRNHRVVAPSECAAAFMFRRDPNLSHSTWRPIGEGRSVWSLRCCATAGASGSIKQAASLNVRYRTHHSAVAGENCPPVFPAVFLKTLYPKYFKNLICCISKIKPIGLDRDPESSESNWTTKSAERQIYSYQMAVLQIRYADDLTIILSLDSFRRA